MYYIWTHRFYYVTQKPSRSLFISSLSLLNGTNLAFDRWETCSKEGGTPRYGNSSYFTFPALSMISKDLLIGLESWLQNLESWEAFINLPILIAITFFDPIAWAKWWWCLHPSLCRLSDSNNNLAKHGSAAV